MKYPVIILCDNDKGLTGIIKNAKSKRNNTVTISSDKDCYPLGLNLYLVKVPEGDPPEAKKHRIPV